MLPTHRGADVADDPLILHLDAFGAAAPQRVEHRLDVLLMHDEIVGGCVAGEPAVGVALGVGEGDDEPGAADRIEAGVGGQDVVTVLDRRQRGVGARRPAVVGVDLGDEVSRCALSRSTDCWASLTRSTNRGASLRLISSPPETPWVAASSSPASRQTSGTPKRQAALCAGWGRDSAIGCSPSHSRSVADLR